MYQIIKGWPSAGALDLTLSPSSGVTITPGVIGAINGTTGAVDVASYSTDGANAGNLPVMCIAVEAVTGKLTCLPSNFVVKVDSACYTGSSFTPNMKLSAVSGKFAAASGTQRVVGQVLSFNASTGELTVLWCDPAS
jgi:hypothetical protein